MSVDAWLVFMAIWILASIPLGPNALNCIACAATHGFRRGLWSVAGVFIAGLIHMVLALSGLAAFLAATPVLFEIIRWLGVVYLAWMGVSLLRSRGTVETTRAPGAFSRVGTLRRAIAISLSNPKAILAWFAVFAQFIDTQASLGPQIAILAPSAMAVSVTVYAGYCALGLGVTRIFSGARKRWFDRITGGAYLGFAAALAAADVRRIA